MNPPVHFLALTHEWWIRWRDVDPIQSALVHARAGHIDVVITSALKANKELGRSPMNLAELANHLSRNTVNLWRWRTGDSEPSLGDMESLAELLHVPIANLFQTRVDLLASATQILCTPPVESRGTPDVKARDAIIYADYLATPNRPRDARPDYAVVTEVLSRRRWVDFSTEKAVLSIWKVARSLEPILAAAARADADDVGPEFGGE